MDDNTIQLTHDALANLLDLEDKPSPLCSLCGAICYEAGYTAHLSLEGLGFPIVAANPNWPFLRIDGDAHHFCSNGHLLKWILDVENAKLREAEGL